MPESGTPDLKLTDSEESDQPPIQKVEQYTRGQAVLTMRTKMDGTPGEPQFVMLESVTLNLIGGKKKPHSLQLEIETKTGTVREAYENYDRVREQIISDITRDFNQAILGQTNGNRRT